MQMSMTFAFADRAEATLILAEVAKMFAAVSGGFPLLPPVQSPGGFPLPPVQPPADPQLAAPRPTSVPTVARAATPVQIDDVADKKAPVPAAESAVTGEAAAPATEPAAVTEPAAAEPKAKRRRRMSEAHEVSSAVASGGKEPVATAGSEAAAEKRESKAAPSLDMIPENPTADQIRKAVNAVATDPTAGGAKAVVKVLAKYGVSKIPDIKDADRRAVAVDLAELSSKALIALCDEIPF